MTGRILKILVPLALLALIVTAWAAESPDIMERRRLQEQERATPKGGKSLSNLPIADGPQDRLNNWVASQSANRSIIQDDFVAHTGLNSVTAAPGLKLAATSYDYQHNDAAPHQIGTLPSPVVGDTSHLVHFVWTHWDIIPESLNRVDRFVNFQSYNSGSGLFIHGANGFTISGAGGDPLQARAGFVTLDVDRQDRAHIAAHQRDALQQPSGDYCSYYWDQSASSFAVFTEGVLNGSKGVVGNADDDAIWPHESVHRMATGPDYYYVVSHPYSSNNNIILWRYNGTIWEGPKTIDSCTGLSYNIAADPTSNKTALVSETSTQYPSNPLGINQIYIRPSANKCNGFGFTDNSELGDAKRQFVTSYNDAAGKGAWLEVVGDYDNSGKLHVVWNEQKVQNSSEQGSWKHWDDVANNITTIHNAFYDNKGQGGGRDIHIAYPTLGFGDGSTTCGASTNLNYVYMTFVQFGGTSATEQADMSNHGYMNGEIYLTTSADGGIRWSPGKNLTNSRLPGCDPTTGPTDSCPSENWPSIARLINDTIHIEYVNDRDAGDAVFGQGAWTFNPVMYYRIPGGTDVQPVCPLIAPNASAELTDANGPDCEYNTPPNTTLNETLRLSNVGNAAMTGVVSKSYLNPPAGTWLSVTTGPYSIPVGGADLSFPVAMNATGLAEGLYKAKISVTHNDPTKTSPFDIPVDFFVFADFACPQWVVMRTKWLELEVGNIERVADGPNRSRVRGMYRNPAMAAANADSGNNSIYDASLFIAKAPAPDTVVYRYIFGQGNYSSGFRPLSKLTVDTAAYGPGVGMAWARANQTTVDSVMGIDIEYQFPQALDSSNFVLLKYKIFNRTASTTFSNLIIGECGDFDVVPSTVNAKYQSGSNNLSGTNSTMNLVYQQGCDTGTTTLARKYFGGMTAIQCAPSPRAWTAANADKLFPTPGGGFYEGYLYRELVKSGFEVIPPSAPQANGGADLHSVIAFEKAVTLAPTTVKHYMMGFVTSTVDAADLVTQTKKAWKYAFGWQDIVTLDTLAPSTPASYPFWASGSHADGVGSPCCGCVVSEVSDPSGLFSLTAGATPCDGTINFAGSTANTYTATFRVTSPGGCASSYTDDQVVTIVVQSACQCPRQGDINSDDVIDVFDVIGVIGIAFSGDFDPQDPGCPAKRGDVNNDTVTDVFDVIYLIATAFSGGAPPVNPCL